MSALLVQARRADSVQRAEFTLRDVDVFVRADPERKGKLQTEVSLRGQNHDGRRTLRRSYAAHDFRRNSFASPQARKTV